MALIVVVIVCYLYIVRHPQPNELTNELRVKIMPPKDLQVDLHIKAFVGNKTR